MNANKILFVYYKLFKPGGVSRVLVSLANELVSDNNEITILILTKDKSSFYNLDKRVKIICIDTFCHWGFRYINVNLDKYFSKLPYKNNIKNYVYDFGQWQILNNWIKDSHYDYDIIITCWYKLSAQLALNKNVAHKTIAWEHISYDVGGVLWNKAFRRYYKNLKSIISINKQGVAYYLKLNKNVFVIPNMMSNEINKCKKIEFIDKENVILIPSRIDVEKNLLEFIDIIKRIDFKDDWIVKIYGNGSEKELLKKKIEEYNLKYVYLSDSLPQSDIFFELKKSKIICMTSLKEGLPTILIEGLFTSNVLVAYDCNYGPSDILNENNGFLIPMHDKKLFQEKLQYLIDNPKVLENLSHTSYLDSKKWKKNEIIIRWEKILDL